MFGSKKSSGYIFLKTKLETLPLSEALDEFKRNFFSKEGEPHAGTLKSEEKADLVKLAFAKIEKSEKDLILVYKTLQLSPLVDNNKANFTGFLTNLSKNKKTTSDSDQNKLFNFYLKLINSSISDKKQVIENIIQLTELSQDQVIIAWGNLMLSEYFQSIANEDNSKQIAKYLCNVITAASKTNNKPMLDFFMAHLVNLTTNQDNKIKIQAHAALGQYYWNLAKKESPDSNYIEANKNYQNALEIEKELSEEDRNKSLNQEITQFSHEMKEHFAWENKLGQLTSLESIKQGKQGIVDLNGTLKTMQEVLDYFFQAEQQSKQPELIIKALSLAQWLLQQLNTQQSSYESLSSTDPKPVKPVESIVQSEEMYADLLRAPASFEEQYNQYVEKFIAVQNPDQLLSALETGKFSNTDGSFEIALSSTQLDIIYQKLIAGQENSAEYFLKVANACHMRRKAEQDLVEKQKYQQRIFENHQKVYEIITNDPDLHKNFLTQILKVLAEIAAEKLESDNKQIPQTSGLQLQAAPPIEEPNSTEPTLDAKFEALVVSSIERFMDSYDQADKKLPWLDAITALTTELQKNLGQLSIDSQSKILEKFLLQLETIFKQLISESLSERNIENFDEVVAVFLTITKLEFQQQESFLPIQQKIVKIIYDELPLLKQDFKAKLLFQTVANNKNDVNKRKEALNKLLDIKTKTSGYYLYKLYAEKSEDDKVFDQFQLNGRHLSYSTGFLGKIKFIHQKHTKNSLFDVYSLNQKDNFEAASKDWTGLYRTIAIDKFEASLKTIQNENKRNKFNVKIELFYYQLVYQSQDFLRKEELMFDFGKMADQDNQANYLLQFTDHILKLDPSLFKNVIMGEILTKIANFSGTITKPDTLESKYNVLNKNYNLLNEEYHSNNQQPKEATPAVSLPTTSNNPVLSVSTATVQALGTNTFLLEQQVSELTKQVTGLMGALNAAQQQLVMQMEQNSILQKENQANGKIIIEQAEAFYKLQLQLQEKEHQLQIQMMQAEIDALKKDAAHKSQLQTMQTRIDVLEKKAVSSSDIESVSGAISMGPGSRFFN